MPKRKPEFFVVDILNIVFNKIVREEIPLLEKNMLRLISKKSDLKNFLLAIKDTQEDLSELHRNESIAYLEKILKNTNSI